MNNLFFLEKFSHLHHYFLSFYINSRKKKFLSKKFHDFLLTFFLTPFSRLYILPQNARFFPGGFTYELPVILTCNHYCSNRIIVFRVNSSIMYLWWIYAYIYWYLLIFTDIYWFFDFSKNHCDHSSTAI